MAEVEEQVQETETGFTLGAEHGADTDMSAIAATEEGEKKEGEGDKPVDEPVKAEDAGEKKAGDADKGEKVQEEVPEKPQVSDADLAEKINGAVKEASGGEVDTFDSLIENYNELVEFHEKYSKLEDDEFIKNAIEYYGSTGDLTPYLEAKTVDFDKMSDMKLLERDIRQQNPHLSDKAVAIKMRKVEATLSKQPDEDMEAEAIEELTLEQEELRGKAEFLRNKYKEDQKKFQMPEKKQEAEKDKGPEATPEQQKLYDAYNQWEENYRSQVKQHKSIKENKLVIDVDGKGEDAFNYSIDNADKFYNNLINTDSFFDLVRQKDGSGKTVTDQKTGLAAVDLDKYVKVVAFARDPDGFIKSLINHGINLGTEQVAREVKNTSTEELKNKEYEEGGDVVFKIGKEFE